MTDPVAALIRRSVSAARKYKSLDLKLQQLVEQSQRRDCTEALRSHLELQKVTVAREMRALSGDL
jgi:hypothetical protein